MTLKDQWMKLKDNWLLFALLVVVVVVMGVVQDVPLQSYGQEVWPYYSSGLAKGEIASIKSTGIAENDFAPEVIERKVTRNAYLRMEIERGEFKTQEEKLKAIVSATNSFILNENVYKSGIGRYESYFGTYTIKVESKKASAVLAQIKELGKISSISENAADITGSYTNLKVELEVERQRLTRYEEMYREAKTIQEKIELNDRIFNQERTIKYLEDSLKNTNQQVDYVTITTELQEKMSEYASITFVTLSEIVRSFVNSTNSVIKLIVFVLPYGMVALVGWSVVRILKRKK
ncbi:DUF4349 domain-containing protein [Candidatus Woesearchaeota archaeon]|nr:DUF4349 domain-containing protein [Candidatus Woesearchaeota archaeon]